VATSEVLDYEQLYADYQTGLVDRLRGFGAAADCLSLWVPDEDPATSLRNLWDAAAAAGEREIAVYLGPTTTASLDGDEVLGTAARFGVATLTHGRTGWLVEVQELRAAAPIVERRAVAPRVRAAVRASTTTTLETSAGAIHPAYVDAIARAAADVQHDGVLSADAGELMLRVEDHGSTLSLVVDRETHVIRRAAFTDAPHAGVMERFCALVEGVPILDAADHGVARLELSLREHRAHRPVAGIVTPRSADPCFALPQALVRAALAEYRAQTGFADWISTHDAGPAAPWRAMSPADRGAAVRTVLHTFVAACDRRPGAVELVAIELDVRLVLRLDEALLSEGGPRLVFELEQALRDAIDPRLEVVLEEIRDRNRKRRLAVVE
jgi:hypothetical protein